VKSRWNIVSPPQRASVKNYVVNVAIKLSSDEASLRANKILLRKLNFVLVQIIKQEWPKFWTSFIPEIVAASRTNESLCENNMEILSLLSEEVFEFGKVRDAVCCATFLILFFQGQHDESQNGRVEAIFHPGV